MEKIVIVSNGLSNGGLERVSAILANDFSRKGYEVLFIAAYDSAREYFLEEKIKYVPIRGCYKNRITKVLARNIRIQKEIKKFGAKMVVSFLVNEMIWTLLSCSADFTFSLRNDPKYVRVPFIDPFLRNLAYRKSKRIIFQTREAAAFFPESVQAKGIVIENPVEVNNLPYWKDCTHEKIFLTACRLTKQKNISMLIDAFVELHQQFQGYKLEIYGKGELEECLRRQIEQNGADTYIALKGHTTQIHEKMAHGFCFVLSSDYEGISNSMLEALAIGIPSICTDCESGGARMFIESGVNGLLTPVGDVHAMCEAMSSIIMDEGLAVRFSENAVKIRERINAETVCQKWESAVWK